MSGDLAEKLEDAAIAASETATEISNAESAAVVAELRAEQAEAEAEQAHAYASEIIEENRLNLLEREVSSWADHLKTFQASVTTGLEAINASLCSLGQQLTTMGDQIADLRARVETLEEPEPEPKSLIPLPSEPGAIQVETLPNPLEKSGAESLGAQISPEPQRKRKRRL